MEPERVVRGLGTPVEHVRDQVIPVLQPELPTNCYRAEYAWQHSYERAFMRRTHEYTGAQRDQLIGVSGLLSEALSNAYLHGNQRDPSRPIQVELIVGQIGYLLSVSQFGQGFDFKDTIAKYKRREKYYFVGGNGLRKLDASLTFGVFFGDGGRALHLWYDPGRERGQLSSDLGSDCRYW